MSAMQTVRLKQSNNLKIFKQKSRFWLFCFEVKFQLCNLYNTLKIFRLLKNYLLSPYCLCAMLISI